MMLGTDQEIEKYYINEYVSQIYYPPMVIHFLSKMLLLVFMWNIPL